MSYFLHKLKEQKKNAKSYIVCYLVSTSVQVRDFLFVWWAFFVFYFFWVFKINEIKCLCCAGNAQEQIKNTFKHQKIIHYLCWQSCKIILFFVAFEM